MRRYAFVVVLVAIIAAIALYTSRTSVTGQEAQRAATGSPATATPRMPDGHPDLNGYWYRRQAPMTPQRVGGSVIMTDSFATLREIHPGTPKYKPEFAAKVKELEKNQVHEDLDVHLWTSGSTTDWSSAAHLSNRPRGGDSLR